MAGAACAFDRQTRHGSQEGFSIIGAEAAELKKTSGLLRGAGLSVAALR
jgi:hypothetical protein